MPVTPLHAAVALLLAILTGPASAPASAAPSAWTRPVDGPLLRAFALGADRFAAGQHRGIDLGAPPGTPVLAACAGRVTFAATVPRGGRTVSVRCGALVATYQHLGVAAVRRGQSVAPGRSLGTVGHARPRPHVHLGARDARSGRYLDPLALIGGGPRAAPPLTGRRRTPPLGSAPRARPLPLAQRPRAHPLRLPVTRSAAQPAPATAPHVPWFVWLGLALFGLGLPLGGGLVVARTRRREPRRRASASVGRVAA